MKNLVILAVAVAFLGGTVPALAQTPEISQLEATILSFETQLNALKQKLAELKKSNAKKPATSSSNDNVAVTKLTRAVKYNEKGTLVKNLQMILAQDPEIFSGEATGYFGPQTYKAIIKFQKKYGLDPVGYIGPLTLKKLNEVATGGEGAVAPSVSAPTAVAKSFVAPTPAPAPTVSAIAPSGPVITDVSPGNIGLASAQIFWRTDRKATSRVYWSSAQDALTNGTAIMIENKEYVLEHNIEIMGIGAGNTYYYYVESVDELGRVGRSVSGKFITATLDSTPPVLSDIMAKNIGQTTATISWKTDEVATTKVRYSTVSPVPVYTGTPEVLIPINTIEHEVNLTGLQPGTMYFYVVSSADFGYNGTTAEQKSFTTLP